MKSVALGNGQMLILLDGHGQVRDFFFPYVGLENHMGGHFLHRIGVWVNGRFHWLQHHSWQISVNCSGDTLASNIVAENAELQVKIQFCDVIYNEKCIFLRKLVITSLGDDEQDIRVFFGQEFEIMESHRGDTAYYDPMGKRVIHYKGRRVFLINAQVGKEGFDQFSTGQFGTHGKAGTYMDAEDGILEGNPIQHGRVDSVIGISMKLKKGETQTAYYWITAGTSIRQAQDMDEYVLRKTPEHILQTTQDYWHAWISKEHFQFCDLSPGIQSLFHKSLMIIRTHIDNNGSVLASGDSDMLHHGYDTYSYMWPRDGALVTISMIKAGYLNLARHFFDFCNDVITQDGYLMHKYRPDGSLGSSWHPWTRDGKITLPIQEDETALVVYALWNYYEASKDLEFIESVYSTLIELPCSFMMKYIDETTGLPLPSYDLWEEKYGTHTFSCGSVVAAFTSAAKFAKELGKTDDEQMYSKYAEQVRSAMLTHLYSHENGFIKMVNQADGKSVLDTTLDMSSLYGIFKFGVLPLDDDRVKRMVELVEDRLRARTDVDGYCRYDGDQYFYSGDGAPGNPWFITTLWLSQYYIATATSAADLKRPLEWMQWVNNHALGSGVLSEQLNPFTGAKVSATPLTWSHAEFVVTVLEYVAKQKELGLCEVK